MRAVTEPLSLRDDARRAVAEFLVVLVPLGFGTTKEGPLVPVTLEARACEELPRVAPVALAEVADPTLNRCCPDVFGGTASEEFPDVLRTA